jgi:hypothetical protein
MVKSSSSGKDGSKTPQAKASGSIDKPSRQKGKSSEPAAPDTSACLRAKVEQLDKTSSQVSFTQLDDDKPITWEGAIQLSQKDDSFRAFLTVSLMHPSFMLMLA